MKNKIKLHTPLLKELAYREKIMGDPNTMSHHTNKNIAQKNYHQKTGCIDFPIEKWAEWYEEYENNDTDLYYGLIQLENGTFVGELSFYKSSDGFCHDMSVLVESKHRRQGFGQEALHQGLAIAFDNYSVAAIELELNQSNIAGIKLCENAGFQKGDKLGNKLGYSLSKQEFMNLQHKKKMLS